MEEGGGGRVAKYPPICTKGQRTKDKEQRSKDKGQRIGQNGENVYILQHFAPQKNPKFFVACGGLSQKCVCGHLNPQKPPNFFRLRRAVSEMCVRPFETSKTPPMSIQFSLHDVRIINYNENLLKLLVNKKKIGFDRGNFLNANECPRENLDGAQV